MPPNATDPPERRPTWPARLLIALPLAIGLSIAAIAALPTVGAGELPGWSCGSVLFSRGGPTLQRVTDDGEPAGIVDVCGDALSTRRKVTAAALVGGVLGSIGMGLRSARSKPRQTERSGSLAAMQ